MNTTLKSQNTKKNVKSTTNEVGKCIYKIGDKTYCLDMTKSQCDAHGDTIKTETNWSPGKCNG